MKCPRCSATFDSAPDELGIVVCPQCGAKLRSRPRSVGPAAAPADIDSVLARLDAPPSPSATLPPGTPLKRIARPEGAGLDAILAEIRAVRRAQDEILSLLRSPRAAAPAAAADVADDMFAGMSEEAPPPVIRARRRKTVLLIDDDEAARQVAVAALEKAEVPVRACADGNGGLSAIAAEKPDVIVLELALSGAMPGKDLINMIKATMEWVDIPIVLYTRVAVPSQKEARTIHGGDELVLKSAPNAPEALVAQVISVFRRG